MATVLVGLAVALSVALGALPAAAAGQASTTPWMSITASMSTVVGLQVFANVNLTGGANPTGTMTYKLFAPSDTTCSTPIFVSTVAVIGTSINSEHFTTTVAGTYRWRATYNGDANNNAAGPTACDNPSAAVIVSPREVGLAVTAQAPSGGTIRASALVGGYSPTGSVTFYLAGISDTFCNGPAIFTSTVTVSGTGSYTSAAYTPTAPGTYKWQAVYSGDQNNMGGTITACLDQNAAVKVTTLGGAPVASLSAAALTFGSQLVGAVSPSQTVALTNAGTSGLVVSSINVTGAQAPDYRATGACTGITITPGGSCSMSISFGPVAVGTSSASLVISDNASPSSQSVTLSGQGAAPNGSKFSYPRDGQTNVNTSSISWTPTPGAQDYYLVLGSVPGGYDLGYWLVPPTQSTYAAGSLASSTVYAVLYTKVNGTWISSDSMSFTAAPGGGTANFTYTTSGPATTFSWPAVAGAQSYYFSVGTSQGGYDIVNSGVLPSTQLTYAATGLPAGTLSARLYTMANGLWTWQDVSFTA